MVQFGRAGKRPHQRTDPPGHQTVENGALVLPLLLESRGEQLRGAHGMRQASTNPPGSASRMNRDPRRFTVAPAPVQPAPARHAHDPLGSVPGLRSGPAASGIHRTCASPSRPRGDRSSLRAPLTVAGCARGLCRGSRLSAGHGLDTVDRFVEREHGVDAGRFGLGDEIRLSEIEPVDLVDLERTQQ
jgi:hypothetical protein